jgi:predicted glycosyltransferase
MSFRFSDPTQREIFHPSKGHCRIMYGISSIGLGHARRSLEIAEKIRSLNQEVQIDWVCAEPVLSFMEASGEHALEISKNLQSIGSAMEFGAKNGRIQDMSNVARRSSKLGKQNYTLIRPSLGEYDALIQDEFVETLFSFMWDKAPPLPKFRVVITDYARFETNSRNPLNKLIIMYANRSLKKAFDNQQLRIFVDDIDALPPNENIRGWVKQNFKILGPVIPKIPNGSKKSLQSRLFPSLIQEKLLVFTMGGTQVGGALAEFVLKNSQQISERIGAHLALILGPALKSIAIPFDTKFISVVPFTTETMMYFKAADCVVTQAGASTLNEIASLGTPCVCIPISNHWEQKCNSERFAQRYGFGLLDYESLTVEKLASAVEKASLNSYRPLDSKDAASVAANLILDRMQHQL